MCYLDQQESDVSAICDLFNRFFNSIYSSSTFPLPSENDLPAVAHNISSLEFTESDVWRVLSQLDPSKAMGHDGLGPAILKACAVPLAAPLSRFFNQCMELSTIPVEWKLHIIVPIHKSGDKSLVNNYRPISLLCSTSKVLEKLIYKHLEDFIIPQISVYQFGFLKGRSCLHKLLVSLADIVDSVNRNLSTDVIYLDLRKAFDTVGHRELLAKLWSFGIHGRLWKWFANYLSDSLHRVSIHGFSSSSSLPVLSGVPQGSILGPLLFLLYINDLKCPTITSSIYMFADDTQCSRMIRSSEDCMILQADLDSIHDWSTKWNMAFNSSKCIHIRFGCGPVTKNLVWG